MDDGPVARAVPLETGQAGAAFENSASRFAGRRPCVALLGNPNTGKTSLFNRLCGLRAKTANFPGTTTDARFGRARIDDAGLDVVDLPGVYSLELEAPESNLVRRVLAGEAIYQRPDLLVVVVDATNLVRNLMFVSQVAAYGLPLIVALNMVDIAARRGLTVDAAVLSEAMGWPVIATSARSGAGFESLVKAIREHLDGAPVTASSEHQSRSWEEREQWAETVVDRSLRGEGRNDTFVQRLDRAFTHPVLGLALFGLTMAGLFWVLFALAAVPMDLIDAIFGNLGSWIEHVMPAGAIRDLLVGGVVGGLAGTVVFLPQICLLFFLISLLEDTGYLARGAFVMDRLLCRFGLPGQAFVPLLSSHACAIPGILAAKLIPNRRDRLATILVAPFMSCSARLPVYVLLSTLLFGGRPLLAGLVFVGCYLLGAVAALLSAALFRRSLLPGRSAAMVLELPSYKAPSVRNALLAAVAQGWSFLRTAGTVIMALCIVMWWLSAYPKSGPSPAGEELRAQVQTTPTVSADRAAELLVEARLQDARFEASNSFAGRMGRLVQPVFAPLGLDWQLTVAVLTSFVAREVFVSTLAVLVAADEDDTAGVLQRIRSARRDDGSPLLPPRAAAALLVFFVLAMQCLSTLVVTRRETGQWRWAALQLGYMGLLAWGLGALVYQGLRLAGVAA